MPRKSRLNPPPIDLGPESIGKRIARIRKSKGYTQKILAERMGIIQVLISDYERDKIRPHIEMLARFSLALEVSSDELLGLKPVKTTIKIQGRTLRRLEKIEQLPTRKRKTLLNTIDTFLRGVLHEKLARAE